MKKILFYILAAIIFLAPYKYLEQDNVNGMLFGIIAVFSICILKDLKLNKRYGICLIIMTVISILTLTITSLTVESLQGLSLYLSLFLLYLIFVQFKEEEEDVLKITTYVMAANCVFYMIIQGAYFNGGILEGRIDGNIGYANTYALMMLIALYFNNIREKDSIKGILDLLFIQGVLLTGSRNTLLYLGLFALANLIYKKKKTGKISLIMIFNCILGELMYLIISKLRLGGVLIIPIILIFYFFYVEEKNRKLINILTLIAVPVGFVGIFFMESNLASRISAASLNSNELQLRFGYLEDVIRYVFKNPLGGGLNTYMYNQGSFQTGFYDVRYVHNSFGQVLYDMGFIGLIAFTALFITGLLVILKGSNKNKFYYSFLYLTVYMHSILDFDFAYLVVFLVIAMIVAFSGEVDIFFEKKLPSLKVITAISGAYLLFTTIMYCVAERELFNGNYTRAVKESEILSKATIKDNSSKLIIFEGMRSLYYDTGNIEYLKSAVKVLEESEGKNRKSYVYNKLASGYEELGNIDKSSEYHEKELDIQNHAKYVYDSYCNMLTRAEERTDADYGSKKDEIMNRYYTIEAQRSEKSKKRFGQY